MPKNINSKMKAVSPHITTCEVFRMINDLCQSDSEKDNEIRDLCVLGYTVGKMVSLEVPSNRLKELVSKRKTVVNVKEVELIRATNNHKDSWHKKNEIASKWGICGE